MARPTVHTYGTLAGPNTRCVTVHHGPFCCPWPADHDVQETSRSKVRRLTTSMLSLLVHQLDLFVGDTKIALVSIDENKREMRLYFARRELLYPRRSFEPVMARDDRKETFVPPTSGSANFPFHKRGKYF